MAAELNKNYAAILNNLKGKIRMAGLQAALAVNTELLKVYRKIGGIISKKE